MSSEEWLRVPGGSNCRPGVVLGLFLWMCLLTLVASLTPQTDRFGAETQLLKDLLDGYDNQARPVHDPLDVVNVSVSFNLVQIGDLNSKHQTMHILGFTEIFWQDEYLTWEPMDYGGTTRLILDSARIWRPDFGIENSAHSMYTDLNSPTFKAIVTSNGSVYWSTSGEVTVNCPMVMTAFPFDKQTCHIELISWSYGGDQMRLLNMERSIKMEMYQENGQWEIVETRMDTTFVPFENNVYYRVDIAIALKRKPLFYLMNILLPCLMLSMLVMLVFALPADSGEKVSLGITVLLSFSVFQLLVAGVMPETSDNTPAISMYLLGVMGLSALSILCTVIVLSVHHSDAAHSPPRWLQRLTLGILSRLLLMPKSPVTGAAEDQIRSCIVGNFVDNELDEVDKVPKIDDGVGKEDHDVKIKLLLAMKQDLSTIISALVVDESSRALVQEKWMAVAKVLDRSFMVLFLLATLLVTIVLLGTAPNA